MNEAIIFHHLGLGDTLICNGLVRHISELHENVKVLCKPHNMPTVNFMYRDISNLELIKVEGDIEALSYISNNSNLVLYKAGFEKLYNYGKGLDYAFYMSCDIDFSCRWSKFKVVRDEERENSLYKNLVESDNDYIFVHDDSRFSIDMNRIRNDLKIVRPDPKWTPILFDYCKIIENAKEVHTIESSFQFMIDSLKLNSENYIHRYPRPLADIEKPVYQSVKQIFM